jgi:hypothetical protein
MPRLTIIVPLMDQVDAFEMTLASVLRYAGAQVEVLAAVTSAYEDQYNILDEIRSVVVDARLVSTPVGRAALAADSATSPWIYWVAPGLEMTPAALAGALELVQYRDLGIASPRIISQAVESGGLDGTASAGKVPCLASSLVMTARFHPLCVEELVGEQWSPEDLAQTGLRVAGPTGWGGLVQRQLLEQWPSALRRLPAGYAELSLGLWVQENGWTHDWADGELLANESVAAQIEAGFRLCGRSSNRLLELANRNSRSSVAWIAVRTGLAELARGCLSPQSWRVTWERLANMSSLGRRSAAISDVAAATASADEDSTSNNGESASRTGGRNGTHRRKSMRSAA